MSILRLPILSVPSNYLMAFFICYIIDRGIGYAVSYGITVTSDGVLYFSFGVIFLVIG